MGVGGEDCCRRFRFCPALEALCAGTSGLLMLLMVLFSSALPVPALEPGASSGSGAMPAKRPPLIYLFFGQQGGAGFSHSLTTRWLMAGRLVMAICVGGLVICLTCGNEVWLK